MLRFIYRTIECSVPLLRFAARHAKGELKEYYKKHIDEEKGHDEILLDDLRRCGILEIPDFIDAAELIGVQYYLIAHKHPAALLGYMRALEKENLPIEAIEAIEQELGTEMKCLRLHADLDKHHIQDIDKQIAKLSEDLQILVRSNEEYTIAKYAAGFAAMGYK